MKMLAQNEKAPVLQATKQGRMSSLNTPKTWQIMPKCQDLSTEKIITHWLKEALTQVFIAKAAHFFIAESVALLLALVLTWGVA